MEESKNNIEQEFISTFAKTEAEKRVLEQLCSTVKYNMELKDIKDISKEEVASLMLMLALVRDGSSAFVWVTNGNEASAYTINKHHDDVSAIEFSHLYGSLKTNKAAL